MHQHLFWVAVGVLQQGEPTLYSVGLELMEACIKVLTSVSSFRMEVSLDTKVWMFHSMLLYCMTYDLECLP